MILSSKYDIGQPVYIVTDKEQSCRMIIGIMIRPSGVLYELGCGNASTWHYEIEVSETKDILQATTG